MRQQLIRLVKISSKIRSEWRGKMFELVIVARENQDWRLESPKTFNLCFTFGKRRKEQKKNEWKNSKDRGLLGSFVPRARQSQELVVAADPSFQIHTFGCSRGRLTIPLFVELSLNFWWKQKNVVIRQQQAALMSSFSIWKRPRSAWTQDSNLLFNLQHSRAK